MVINPYLLELGLYPDLKSLFTAVASVRMQEHSWQIRDTNCGRIVKRRHLASARRASRF
jgi:hypothetical protein